MHLLVLSVGVIKVVMLVASLALVVFENLGELGQVFIELSFILDIDRHLVKDLLGIEF